MDLIYHFLHHFIAAMSCLFSIFSILTLICLATRHYCLSSHFSLVSLALHPSLPSLVLSLPLFHRCYLISFSFILCRFCSTFPSKAGQPLWQHYCIFLLKVGKFSKQKKNTGMKARKGSQLCKNKCLVKFWDWWESMERMNYTVTSSLASGLLLTPAQPCQGLPGEQWAIKENKNFIIFIIMSVFEPLWRHCSPCFRE